MQTNSQGCLQMLHIINFLCQKFYKLGYLLCIFIYDEKVDTSVKFWSTPEVWSGCLATNETLGRTGR